MLILKLQEKKQRTTIVIVCYVILSAKRFPPSNDGLQFGVVEVAEVVVVLLTTNPHMPILMSIPESELISSEMPLPTSVHPLANTSLPAS